MNANAKEVASGAFFVFAGLFYGWMTLSGLRIGEALNMGPGYFPIVLSGLLVVMGSVVAIRGLVAGMNQPIGVIAWRGAIMITIAIVAFTLTLEHIGLFPASVLTALIACFSIKGMQPLKALIVSLAIAVFCTVVFHYVIKLPVPMFGPLFSKLFG